MEKASTLIRLAILPSLASAGSASASLSFSVAAAVSGLSATFLAALSKAFATLAESVRRRALAKTSRTMMLRSRTQMRRPSQSA
jgi:hypothetical protein